ncbi:polysaccharide deacetylase family protein [Halalkalicoccus sp. NIPERK01]|uniref:polysaccharide deacetylase family protein n=1 Tax=Halalkalicoccus sp. NIPERK01 TaxID=3053469 RepID=UPI00256F3478|nr:polysaccharide deacetylase family protein [Halalkalicoccus sp. NIPERK01]MDL5361410.1 polysaccharide deacetylase family protein [Halalkalicoccus sp. NIPERK01]
MEKPSPSRRTFLGLSAASLAGLSGCLGSLRTETDGTSDGNTSDTDPDGNETDSDDDREEPLDPPEGGAVVFVYDDGPLEDYTQAFPAHRAFDAPATVGVVSDWLGREDYQQNGCMDVAHLEELVEAGWEVASHTTEHTTLGTFELTEDARPGDERIYPEEIRHGYHRGKTIEFVTGERVFERAVSDYGSDGTGRYIAVDEPIDETCVAGETRVRYPAEQMHAALGDSKRALERAGFAVDTLLAPYDNFDDYSREFVAEYYSGVANARHGSRINDPEGFDPYYTRRDYFIEFTSRESVRRDLDEVAERGALGVIGAHTFKEEVTEERIRETLSWVTERGISVLTLRDAIARYAH